MNNSTNLKNLKYGILAGLLEGVYIFIVSIFMFTIQDFFSSNEMPGLTFAAFLFLFVFSAGISGIILFGYPFYLVTNKKYREAVVAALVSLSTILVLFGLVIIIITAVR